MAHATYARASGTAALIALAAMSGASCSSGELMGEDRSRDRGAALLAGDGAVPADPYVPGRQQRPDGGPCVATETCGDGYDNDCNGDTDCDDANCAPDPSCRTCTPERCDNRVDDDCDGQTDCDDTNCVADPTCEDSCVETTVDCGYTSCTDSFFDGSDPAACMAGGNPGRCPDHVWIAWCSRRAYPGSGDDWDALHRDWVLAQCSGTLEMIGGLYTCRDDATCTTYECTTPLVLVFDAAARVLFTPWTAGEALVDLSAEGDGSETRADWPTAATPWLALDRNGDGRIGSGRELFGSATLVEGRAAANGFDALDALDADRDGDVDADDPAFAELVAWADENGDRLSTRDELRSMAALGVTSLGVSYADVPMCDGRGNCERERAAMTWRDARGVSRDGALVDVHVRGDGATLDAR